jgi:NAD(P)-dependent dehydrogenase (short-subunit alcohol dehydrogenase family)
MSQTALTTGASGGSGKAFAEALAVRVAPKTVVLKVIRKWQSGLIERGGRQ